jgi:hypothetical protein
MSNDTRELILQRLVEVARTIEGVKRVFRNQTSPDESSYPAIVILDANEAKRDMGLTQGRPGVAPAIMELRPEIFLVLGDLPEDVGSALNAFRAKIISAIIQDEQLNSLCGAQPDRISYDGCATGLSSAREIVGAMMLSFTFAYVLRSERPSS